MTSNLRASIAMSLTASDPKPASPVAQLAMAVLAVVSFKIFLAGMLGVTLYQEAAVYLSEGGWPMAILGRIMMLDPVSVAMAQGLAPIF